MNQKREEDLKKTPSSNLLGNPLVPANKYFHEGVRLCVPLLKILEQGHFKRMRWVDIVAISEAVESVMFHADKMQKSYYADMAANASGDACCEQEQRVCGDGESKVRVEDCPECGETK